MSGICRNRRCYFFSTNKKAHALLEDFFKDCFGLLLLQQIPYVTAEHLLVEEQGWPSWSISLLKFLSETAEDNVDINMVSVSWI